MGVVGRRRLSERISEGDGISVLVHAATVDDAAAAERLGAVGVVLAGAPAGSVRELTSLPILARGIAPEEAAAAADAWLLVAGSAAAEDELEDLFARAEDLGLECVVDVQDEEEMEAVLERLDPEILLLSPRAADGEEGLLERVLDLLPDVPAGKLAVADLGGATADDIAALERAGVDAVLVGPQIPAGWERAASPPG